MNMMRIALVQSRILWEDRAGNLEHYGLLLRRISGQADIAVLPETFSTGFSMNTAALADVSDGETVAAVKDWAAKYQFAIAGSFIAKENGQYFNRAFLVTPEGEEHYYDKRHLFRMGGEDRHFSAGNRQTIVPYKGWNVCLQVCYDLRFPVWSRNTDNAYDLLIYIANWPAARERAWRVLLPARAMENMAFVCGVNRIGTDGNDVPYNGGSLLFDPKGTALADLSSAEDIVVRTIEKDGLDSFRTKFPAWKDADNFIIHP